MTEEEEDKRPHSIEDLADNDESSLFSSPV